MDKCPSCGGRLYVAKHEYKYKHDWMPFIKTKRLQRTVFVCMNTNHENETREEDDYREGKPVKAKAYYPVPCPMYAGIDLNNPKAIVHTSEWVEVE